MKILVVDDSKPITMMVKQMLSEKNIESNVVFNAQELIEHLKTTQDYNLILLDWNMPILNGIDFLKLNKDLNLTKIPIVMMTTETKPEMIKQAMSLGASEYIMKPFNIEILEEKIKSVLENDGF